MFLASRVLSGVGAGVLTALATSAAAALVATERRGRAMALVTFGLSAGTVAGVPTGMLIGHHVGWRWTMGLVVAVGLVSMLAVLLRSQAMPPLDAGGARVAVILTPQVAIGVALAFVFGLASLGLYTYLLPMAAERGVGSWGFTFVWAWGVGGVAGSMVAGPLIDGLGSRRLLPGVAVLLVASFAALALLDGPAAWLVAIALWGACGWGGVPVLQDVLTRSRQERTTSVVAFQMAAMYLGASAGSALGSALLGAGTSAGDLPLAAPRPVSSRCRWRSSSSGRGGREPGARPPPSRSRGPKRERE
ncbi:MFS transporter [Actinoalloteichus sp. AHMU CJ021]|uniref:MFS transporter n=1 Tax=Actinoalloteichus sp. AHMU CJ021 TaxID=2072503 RepID=UPI00267D65BE